MLSFQYVGVTITSWACGRNSTNELYHDQSSYV